MRKLTLPLVAAVATAALAMSPAKAQDIVVATAGPITGQYASFGEQMKRGAERAVADINAAGGLLGKQLRLEVGDDACVPEQARSVAEDLVSKGVAFVAGHFCSSSSISNWMRRGSAFARSFSPRHNESFCRLISRRPSISILS